MQMKRRTIQLSYIWDLALHCVTVQYLITFKHINYFFHDLPISLISQNSIDM